MKTLEAHRRFYAEFIVRSSGSKDARLIDALAAVPREHHLGPGPWPMFVGDGYMASVSDDPALLYQDILIGLARIFHQDRSAASCRSAFS